MKFWYCPRCHKCNDERDNGVCRHCGAKEDARGGQPLTTVPYEVAQGQEGVVFEETEDAFCKGGACGA